MPSHRLGIVMAVLIAALTNFAAHAQASGDASASGLDVVSAHLEARDATLGRQQQAARALSQQHAWMAYRLSRRRALGFFSNTERRPEQARAAAMSLEVLGRSLQEADKIAVERARVQTDRASLLRQQRPALAGGAPQAAVSEMLWPTKGPIISGPGLRADAVTGVILRDPGVQILARVDAPVVCPADAVVKRIELLPAGGYGIVLAQQNGATSVLLGLRSVEVSAGDEVIAGQRVGKVGRTLDGAPVLRFAIWQHGQPVDARSAAARRKSR